jgi:hypothetical protein
MAIPHVTYLIGCDKCTRDDIGYAIGKKAHQMANTEVSIRISSSSSALKIHCPPIGRYSNIKKTVQPTLFMWNSIPMFCSPFCFSGVMIILITSVQPE